MQIFIIVPSLSLSGPIKGALALANSLSKDFDIILVFLKTSYPSFEIELNSNIEYLFLGKYESYLKKYKFLQEYLNKSKEKKKLLFSMCLSADLFTLFLDRKILKISSIRSNLFTNYFYVYNILGYPVALFHLIIQNLFDLTIVMNEKMKKQVNFFSKKEVVIIKNFIDEEKLSSYFKKEIDTTKPKAYVFLGSLTKRKNPFSLIKAFEKLLTKEDVKLHIIGDGPLKKSIKNYISRQNLENNIFLHGFLNNPYEILSKSDLFILPSFSEGTSRAALEALFLGVPIILRDVECNYELIVGENQNGYLFKEEQNLHLIMNKLSDWSRERYLRQNLLPKIFQKESVIKKYKILFNNLKI